MSNNVVSDAIAFERLLMDSWPGVCDNDSNKSYQELSDIYEMSLLGLKRDGESYPYDRYIEISSECDYIEKQLPDVSDRVFERYVYLVRMLGMLNEACFELELI